MPRSTALVPAVGDAVVGRQALSFFRLLIDKQPRARAALEPLVKEALAGKGSRVPWDVVAQLHDRLDDVCDAGETIDDLATLIAESSELNVLFRMLRLVASPAAIYRLVFKWSGPRIFPHVEVTYEELGDGWLEVALCIPPPHRGCENFFRLAGAQARILPTILGAGEAIVETVITEREGRYRILPPQDETVLARLRRALRSLLFGRHAIRELGEQESRLAIQFRQLQATCRELEHQKRAAIEAQRRAESALVARRRFLCAINHELRTPLNGVVGTLPLIRSARGAAQGELLDAAEGSAARLSELVDTVLRVAEHSGAVAEGEVQRFDLSWLAHDLALAHRILAEASGLTFVLRSDAGPAVIHADRNSISGIVSCLLDNAIRFTIEGSVTLDVRTCDSDPLTARITVSDTGPGIAAAQLPDLFRGTGKLAWCRARANQLGGELTYETGRGGTAFSLTLPVASPDRSPTDASTVPQERSRARVLVAEDNEVNRMVIERHLLALGVEVTMTEDGAAAVDAVQREAFDLVLMDCDMPVLDGYGATRQIRALDLDVPIVAVTAYTAEEDRLECTASGMDGFVPKPIRREMLVRVLDDFVDYTRLASCGSRMS